MNNNMKRYFQFALVILASGSIFPLIYLKAQYQETILTVFNMTQGQLNIIFTALGFACLIGYFPSGLLCDKFSAKNLLSISLLITGIGGFWFAQVPSYTQVVMIFVMWGFSSVLTFWGAHLKVTQMLAGPNEEGRFFGILDAGKGLVEAVLASIALTIFTATLGGSTEETMTKSALVAVIYMYSIVLVVVSVLIFIFVKEVEVEKAESNGDDKINFAEIGKVLKNKYVILQGVILFAGYVVFWTNYYYSGYLQGSLGISPEVAGSIMVGVLWTRPVGGVVGGFLADKIGKAFTLGLSLTGGCLGLLAMCLAPVDAPATVFGGIIIITGLTLYMIRGTYWSLLGDAGINPAIMGTAIGIVSLIGYLPDIILPTMNTYLYSTYDSLTADRTYFLISMGVGIVGIIGTRIYIQERKKDAAKAK